MGNVYKSDKEIKELICEIGRRAYEKGYVAGADGNISIKCGDDAVWVTPTGVSKGYMTPDMLVKMDLKGNVLEQGALNPSSEAKMHLKVYEENPDVRSVVHAHPVHATAFAVSGRSLDKAYMGEGVIYLGVVHHVAYAEPGTTDVPDSIIPYCKDYSAVFLGNHGSLTWGDTEMDAYFRLESLEQSCKITMLVEDVMGESVPLTEMDVTKLMKQRAKYGLKRGGVPKIIG